MSAFRPPKLGTGMIFSPSLKPFLERRPDAIDVLELEPQTLWIADSPYAGPFFELTPAMDYFADLPGHKLVHSVGMPLAGTRAPDSAQLKIVCATAERLNAPWVSEHLSIAGTPHESAGFLLPPLQTEAGQENAVRNIRSFKDGVNRPVAIETGVAYLARKPFEMPDGTFLARVVQEADCGILLDIHNLYCNMRNGRVDLDDFLSQIPLDGVWEVHLAGGMEMDGYWLDAHSGEMTDDIAGLSREIIQSLPNLGALNFEIYDTFLADMSLASYDRITDQLRDFWTQAGHSVSDAPPLKTAPEPTRPLPPTPEDWEQAMVSAVWRARPDLVLDPDDKDPLALYAKLARSFRGSMITRVFPRLLRYLLLRDRHAVDGRLKRYFGSIAPQMFAPLEARAFAGWLRSDGETDPLALALMDFDLALIQIVRDGAAHFVQFPGDPGPVFEALAERRLPACPAPPVWELEILPDSFSVPEFLSHSGSS
ncbi:DUF692 domain-containing protein [Phaeobacter marinintestinus]|uniref:DUF692 domain-containing protein n=1 Tax=Falsiphaeobacter marinintestinus TaxID=1492905 RepID=UPI0011B802B5|nr:DUF692 family multinuclear iron-containing protein [Phaeobacter marinintestinus]